MSEQESAAGRTRGEVWADELRAVFRRQNETIVEAGADPGESSAAAINRVRDERILDSRDEWLKGTLSRIATTNPAVNAARAEQAEADQAEQESGQNSEPGTPS